MVTKTLRELYAGHTGKVSDKWSLYLREYDRLGRWTKRISICGDQKTDA